MIEGITNLEHIRTCQNHLFKASLNGIPCVVRLTEQAHRSINRLQAEIDLLSDLHSVTGITILPMRFPSGNFIEPAMHAEKSYNATLFPFVDGSPVQLASFVDATRFGSLLAQLHLALASVESSYDLPVTQNSSSARQLIHGDFNSSNVLTTDRSYTIFDFENACYSTYEYELANSIYMTFFDYRHDPIQFQDSEFISGFLAGYTSKKEIDRRGITDAIDLRVSRLERWRLNPSDAPLSIRNSSDAWKRELDDFLSSYKKGKFDSIMKDIM